MLKRPTTPPFRARWPQAGRFAARLTLGAALAILSSVPAAAQTAGGQVAAQPATADADAPTVRLELRVFDGSAEVTSESRVKLFKKGQRGTELPLTQASGAGAAATATVPVGFYDAQAIRERRSQLSDLRWAESLLIQKYPDEYGRHLEMINFKIGYGGLQIRPAPADAAAAKGWSAVAYAAGASDGSKELAKAVSAGEDLLIALPGGRYDIKLTMPDRSTQWMRDVDVPSDRTRLKTWSSSAPGAPASR